MKFSQLCCAIFVKCDLRQKIKFKRKCQLLLRMEVVLFLLWKWNLNYSVLYVVNNLRSFQNSIKFEGSMLYGKIVLSWRVLFSLIDRLITLANSSQINYSLYSRSYSHLFEAMKHAHLVRINAWLMMVYLALINAGITMGTVWKKTRDCCQGYIFRNQMTFSSEANLSLV